MSDRANLSLGIPAADRSKATVGRRDHGPATAVFARVMGPPNRHGARSRVIGFRGQGKGLVADLLKTIEERGLVISSGVNAGGAGSP